MSTEEASGSEDRTVDAFGFPIERRHLEQYEKTKQEREQRRHIQWCHYLRRCTEECREEYREMAYSGSVPEDQRALYWQIVTGSREQLLTHPGRYGQLHKEHAGETNEATEAIELDLKRTFPRNPQFAAHLPRLHRVLHAFAFHCPAVGYCQGLNFVTGFMLLLMSEEEAFWMLDRLVSPKYMDGFYTAHLEGLQTEMRVLQQLVEYLMPGIAQILRATNVDLALISASCFVKLYIDTVPSYTALRILDAFFLDGPDVLTRVFLVALLHNPELRLFVERLPTEGREDHLMTQGQTVMSLVRESFSGLHDPDSILREIAQYPQNTAHLLSDAQLRKRRQPITEEVHRDSQHRRVQGKLASLRRETNLSLSEIQNIHRRFMALFARRRKLGRSNTNDNLASSLDDPSKVIGIEQFSKLIRDMFPEMVPRQCPGATYFLRRLFDALDTLNTNGAIDFRELALGLGVLRHGSLDDKLKLCFDVFDEEHEGRLAPKQVLRMMTSVTQMLEPDAPGSLPGALQRVADMAFLQLDRNHDGYLDYREFRAFVMVQPVLARLLSLNEDELQALARVELPDFLPVRGAGPSLKVPVRAPVLPVPASLLPAASDSAALFDAPPGAASSPASASATASSLSPSAPAPPPPAVRLPADLPSFDCVRARPRSGSAPLATAHTERPTPPLPRAPASPPITANSPASTNSPAPPPAGEEVPREEATKHPLGRSPVSGEWESATRGRESGGSWTLIGS